MAAVPCAPTDPIFWMHHGFVDYLWEEYRTDQQSTDVQLEYPAPESFPEEYPV